MTLAPATRGAPTVEVGAAADREHLIERDSWPTSAGNLFYLDLFAGGNPVLLATGFYDRVHVNPSLTVDPTAERAADARACEYTHAALRVSRRACDYSTRVADASNAAASRRCRAAASVAWRAPRALSYNRPHSHARCRSPPSSAASPTRPVAAIADLMAADMAAGRRGHPPAPALRRRADRPDRQLHHQRRRQADPAAAGAAVRRALSASRAASASSWRRWSSSSTPRRCCTTTWSTSRRCGAAARPPTRCSAMPPACWSATSSTRAPSR